MAIAMRAADGMPEIAAIRIADHGRHRLRKTRAKSMRSRLADHHGSNATLLSDDQRDAKLDACG